MPVNAPQVRFRAMRRSFTRRLWSDDSLPQDMVDAIVRGEIERFLYAATPLQVKDRCIAARYDHPSRPLLIKMHLWGGAWRTFRSVAREASALRCARLGLEFHQRGIRTPLPRLCLEQRFGPWGTRSFLVTDYVEGTSLYRYIRFGSQSDDEIRHLAQQVASLWDRMVDAGISHNDFKPENFIVDDHGAVWLIDLEKARIEGNSARHRKRCVFDAKNFLHIRGWHLRTHAREIFLDELLKTPHGNWLESIAQDRVTDSKLTVEVLIESEPRLSAISQAIDSVRDIADEVMLVADDGQSTLVPVDRMVLCGEKTRSPAYVLPAFESNEWLLVIKQNEMVTPFLAKELQQCIAEENSTDAFHIPIESKLFGCTVKRPHTEEGSPIRLFRRDACRYSVARDTVDVLSNSLRTSSLTGNIQRCVYSSVDEYVHELNARTSESARQRLHGGHRPALYGAMLRALWHGLRQTMSRGGIMSGWAGLQQAFLEAAFVYVEEAKLRQLSGEFFLNDESTAVGSAAATGAAPAAASNSAKRAA